MKELYDDKGRMVRPKQRRVFAKFRRGMAPGWAVAIGVGTFPMKDRPPEVDPAAWLCAYDSDADEWNDEEKAAVEAKLEERGYLRVEKPRLKAPYPMYDKHRKTAQGRTIATVVKDIEAAYESAGFNLDAAIAYEQENGADEKVLAALEGLRETPTEVESLDDVIAA